MKDFMEFISIPVILLFSMGGLFMSFLAYVFLSKQKTIEKGSNAAYEVQTKYALKSPSVLSISNAEPNIKHFSDLRVFLQLLKHALCILREKVLARKSFYFSEYASCSITCNDYNVFALRRILV